MKLEPGTTDIISRPLLTAGITGTDIAIQCSEASGRSWEHFGIMPRTITEIIKAPEPSAGRIRQFRAAGFYLMHAEKFDNP